MGGKLAKAYLSNPHRPSRAESRPSWMRAHRPPTRPGRDLVPFGGPRAAASELVGTPLTVGHACRTLWGGDRGPRGIRRPLSAGRQSALSRNKVTLGEPGVGSMPDKAPPPSAGARPGTARGGRPWLFPPRGGEEPAAAVPPRISLAAPGAPRPRRGVPRRTRASATPGPGGPFLRPQGRGRAGPPDRGDHPSPPVR